MRVLLQLGLFASVAAAACLSATLTPAARAETLGEALALAYDSNPTLLAQRAQQRALDEAFVQARAGYRPSLGASVSENYAESDLPKKFGGSKETKSTSLTLSASQTLFSGGRVAANVSAAEAQILAGREGLRAAEAAVLQQVISAYVDVRRDQEAVAIQQENVTVLKNQLDEAKAKFEVGQLTRTDTAQAQAQYAQAKGALTSAKAQLEISRAAYAAVVGRAPASLAAEPTLPGLPDSVEEAFDLADKNAPAIRQAVLAERASRAKVDAAKAANHPSVAATASYGPSNSALSRQDIYSNQFVAGVTVTQPLFTGGLNESLIRQAREQNTADRIDIEKQRRGAVQQVSQAWSNILSARANVATDEEAVTAAKVAAEGAREEYRVGRRITLDVLQAEKQVRDAELALVQARHDGYLAEAQLLAAVGRLEARNLLDSPKLYDPQAAFKKVRSAGATPLDGLAGALDSLGRAHTKPIGIALPSSDNASGLVRTGPGVDAPPVK